MSRVYILKGEELLIGSGRRQVVAYIHESEEADDIVVDLLRNYSGEALFDVIKIVLEDKELPEDIVIVTDNLYVFKTLTIYYKNWQNNGWKTSKGEPVRDRAIIKEILKLPQPRYKYLQRDSWPRSLKKAEGLVAEEAAKQEKILRKATPKRTMSVRSREVD